MDKHLTKQVEAILKEFPKGRDSDQWLTLKIWQRFYPSKIKEMDEVIDGVTIARSYVLLADIMHLPREDNVKRIRARFQNYLKMYLPTTLEVAKKRKMKEAEWKAAMSTEFQRL